jgi:hypothetical protein
MFADFLILDFTGVAVGVFTMIGFVASPDTRPKLIGLLGATYGGLPSS